MSSRNDCVRSRSIRSSFAIAAATLLLVSAGASVANGAIVTNTYNTIVGSYGTPDPDGAFYSLGTPVVVSISFDNSLTYIGGPDTVVPTNVNIPAGLSVTVGSDVFTADNYTITYYNAGPTVGTAIVDFRTYGFPVLHNGLPFAASEPGYLQFTFFGVPYTFTPTPIASGLSFPIPPFVGEGLVRENQASQAHEYYLQQGTWSQVPAPGGSAALLGMMGIVAVRRRRAL